MTLLTSEDKEFLRQHKIAISSVFDAVGLGKKTYENYMKSLGKTVAIGVTPCKRHGHMLRTRSGHCVKCNPAALAFQNRFSENGYVYIAGSQSLQLIKIGFSSDVDRRMASLNFFGYGGAVDWEILYWVYTQDAGQVEYKAHVSLRKFASPTSYIRGEDKVDCLETFSCDVKEAIKAIKTLTSSDVKCWSNTAKLDQYNIKSKSGDNFLRKGFEHDGEKQKTLSRPSKTNILDEFTNKIKKNCEISSVKPSCSIKIERGEQLLPSERKVKALSEDLGVNPDVLLAMTGKVSTDLQKIIKQRPELFSQLIKEIKDLPDHAVLKIVREVKDDNW